MPFYNPNAYYRHEASPPPSPLLDPVLRRSPSPVRKYEPNRRKSSLAPLGPSEELVEEYETCPAAARACCRFVENGSTQIDPYELKLYRRQIPGSDGKGLVIGRCGSRDSIRRDPSDYDNRKRPYKRNGPGYLLYRDSAIRHVPLVRRLPAQIGRSTPRLPTCNISRLLENVAKPKRVLDLGLVEERVGYGRLGQKDRSRSIAGLRADTKNDIGLAY
ncbi:hypothetical protein AG1IA_05749 [Rhizoctonia solani AG-1 IA]|uniref:Uncharacterized protein n=1 Tax=Thanatephorus cucumeris (strain AG1-IA) TaxID=983506 RepID=L8WTV1_THACA|nr:hypothetical protein AG1IA_05749 [Rhizoctonia solani AG-1 IA]